jgi:hypothetical protein
MEKREGEGKQVGLIPARREYKYTEGTELIMVKEGKSDDVNNAAFCGAPANVAIAQLR